MTRSLEISSSGFITIISIIQGVALALLAQNTFANPSPMVYLQSVTILLVFVDVFYFYLSMTVLLRWAPSIMDAFLPFGIAGLEIPPAFFLGDNAAWSAWLGAFWTFTSLGIHITMRLAPLSQFGRNRVAHRLLQKWLRELRTVTGVGGLLMAAVGYLGYQYERGDGIWGIGGAAITLVTLGMVVARTELRLSQIHDNFGVNRPPFN